MAILKFTGVSCILAIIIITVLKDGTPGLKPFVLNKSYMVACSVIGCLLCVFFNAVLDSSLWRLYVATRLQRKWSRRRKRGLTSAYLRAGAMNTVLFTFTVASSLRAAHAEYFCSPSTFVSILDFLHWSGWNTLLLFVLIDGHGIMLRQNKDGRADGQVRDLPYSWHWPKLLLWGMGEGAHACQHLPCNHNSPASARRVG